MGGYHRHGQETKAITVLSLQFLPAGESTEVQIASTDPGFDHLRQELAEAIAARWPSRVVGSAPEPIAPQRARQRRRMENSEQWEFIKQSVTDYEGWLGKGLTKGAAAMRVKDSAGNPMRRRTLDGWRDRVHEVEGDTLATLAT